MTPARSITTGAFALWMTTATVCQAFSTNQRHILNLHQPVRSNHHRLVLWDSESSSEQEEESATIEKKMSLEEKMKSWEASEEEIKAATLGGVVPQPRDDDKERSGAFDVGLYIAFPIMVITGLLFALFPFIMGSIDVDSVGASANYLNRKVMPINMNSYGYASEFTKYCFNPASRSLSSTSMDEALSTASVGSPESISVGSPANFLTHVPRKTSPTKSWTRLLPILQLGRYVYGIQAYYATV